ncbi:uncharacterized protein CIMG_07495 [Coccidioides immitis RS]|uniref:Hyphal anastamosis-8 protein n=1 Tax=Coccidioides immitis (strain RS) TaxID=246410 RepID=J3K3I3_COCIM|nr:uncharacterized protein CIMG_07495 [Coccidioides immitis RS]EAS28749.3 hypothetical protein CIMG_07495 [Coccidioides immitis RS]TPX23070.1 hypothetical protein DIZ76_014952 [Coccidioides immitis]
MSNSHLGGDVSEDSFEPVSPIDIVQPKRKSVGFGPAKTIDIQDTHSSRGTPSPPSLNSPRTPRFTEATSVDSPVGSSSRSPFADPPTRGESSSEPNVSDLGFGYVADNRPSNHASGPGAGLRSNPPNSPLKSALKTPGTPGRLVNPLSPTFKEEQILEYHEKETEEENAKDIKVKTRVRIAKFLLRGVNFSCSLIILALLAHSFVIFNSTRNLASRNSFTPWAPNTNPWPQIVILVIASISLFLCVGVFIAYCRGGHRRAEKIGVYYTVFGACFFAFTIVMWVVAAAILQNSKQSGNDKDLWGWACKENLRSELYSDIVDYALVCRLQDWVLVCIVIEVVVDTITVAIYAVVFYRFWTKHKLRKSMYARDKARSDLYLANLRSQTAPNTPGYPLSPGSMHFPKATIDAYSAAENGEQCKPQFATQFTPTSNQPFQLQPPPIRVQAPTRESSPTDGEPPTSPGLVQIVNQHVGPAPGEKQYGSVPIPESYSSPINSPTFVPQSSTQQIQRGQENDEHRPGTAMTAEHAVQSRSQ